MTLHVFLEVQEPLTQERKVSSEARKCEHSALLSTISLNPLDPDEEDQLVESVLSMYLEETSDLSLFKMRLDFTRPFGHPVPPGDETMWDSIAAL
jgi:hypothetical protein